MSSPEKKTKLNECKKAYRAKTVTKVDIESVIFKSQEIVAQGPLYICACCDQLWYKHTVVNAKKLKKSNPGISKYFFGKKSVGDAESVCKTCQGHLIKNKIPPCAVVNGMAFPSEPVFFDLNELECRLVAPRIAFQKLVQAPSGKQLKIHGNIVNVPSDVTNTVSLLTRLPNDTGIIKINLKRKLQYKISALSMNVRPQKVTQAAEWLMNNGSLYREEGIEISDKQPITSNDSEDENFEEGENLGEDEAEMPAGITDTILTPNDFVEDNERQHILNVAPAEGNRPLSIFRDKYSEELEYPGIFLGQPRSLSKQVHYSDICKSELRRSDRRAAMCVENIIFKTKKLHMKTILGKSNIALRKYKGNNKNLNAHQLKQAGVIDRLIRFDEGFKFLRALRGSPPYFEKAKKDLFAMI